MSVVARLRQLQREATPGPWQRRGKYIIGRDEPRVPGPYVGAAPRGDAAGQTPDATLIVAAVNHLDALLNIAEAAQRQCEGYPDETIRALRDAVAGLETNKETET